MTTMRHDPRTRDDLDLENSTMQIMGPGKGDRQEKFRKRFVELPKEEELIEYYSCALSKDYYLQHGAIYITTNYICFRSNIFGQERKLIIPTAEVQHVYKVNTFRLIPSGLVIVSGNHKYQFESFRNRQAAYETLKSVTEKRYSLEDAGLQQQRGRLRSTDKQSAQRFVKSQSSCSLGRKGKDETDGKQESFLRPLSATVIHDYVVRRNSRVPLSSGLPPDLIVNPCTMVQKEQSCQTERPEIESGNEKMRRCSAVLTIQISSQAVLLFGYFICCLLSFTALMNVKNAIVPSLFETEAPCYSFQASRLPPLNDTFRLLASVIETSSMVMLKVQQLYDVSSVASR